MIQSLVIAPQWLGDAVMCQPLLAALHARGERLSVAALPALAPLFRAMPCVAEVLELHIARQGLQWRARRALAQSWRGRFARAYVLPNSFKSALLPALARVPVRLGYRGEMRWGVLTQRLPNPRHKDAMVAFYYALAQHTMPVGTAPALQLPPEQITAAMHKFGLAPGSYTVLAPGSEYGPAKRWPAGHYAQLAAALAARAPSTVLVLGSAKEQALGAQIALDAGAHCRNLAGQTQLSEALALIAAARAVVSNDSGLMHVAAAFGKPQVALFGSSSPLYTPPLNPQAQVLWLKQDPAYQPPLICAPCFARECRFGHTRCLRDLPPQRVLGLLPG